VKNGIPSESFTFKKCFKKSGLKYPKRQHKKAPSKKPLKKVPLYIEYFSRAKEDKKRMNGRKSRSFGRYV